MCYVLFLVDHHFLADQTAVFCQALDNVNTSVQFIHIADRDALAFHIVDIQHVNDSAVGVFLNSSDFDSDVILAFGREGEVGLAVFVDGGQLISVLPSAAFIEIGGGVGFHFNDDLIFVYVVVSIEVVVQGQCLRCYPIEFHAK